MFIQKRFIIRGLQLRGYFYLKITLRESSKKQSIQDNPKKYVH